MTPRLLTAAAAALFGLAGLSAGPALAQPVDWHLGDAATDDVPGISLTRAYDLLEGREPAREVVVAIIDSGVDLDHPDLAPVLWTNPDETPGNGRDDDDNGYADDVHGWSFLAGPGGTVQYERLELARLVAQCRAGDGPDGYDCDGLEEALADERRDLAAQAAQMGPIFSQVREADALLREQFGGRYDPESVSDLDVGGREDARRAQQLVAFLGTQGATPAQLAEYETYLTTRLEYHLNPDYDPRAAVGDDPADATERGYGSPDAEGPDASHGTGVAGLVAAVRGDDGHAGIDGIAPNSGARAAVRIMALRAVPDGDERDKDVAAAIRYAVDNGAHIINMSFGKPYSPDKDAVDDAVAYAVERGVLLVHAAGNDGRDLEAPAATMGAGNFPSATLGDGARAATWIEVGASTADAAALAAPFSNYGASRVDLFAPGAAVTSLESGGGTATHDGTSFAAPVVSGVAALLMAYFPDLTAQEVRQILVDSATRYADAETTRPGDGGGAVRFGTLSATGGVVNAAAAVEMALARAGD